MSKRETAENQGHSYIPINELKPRDYATGKGDNTMDPPRPRTRGECENGPRPCPYFCRHNLLYDASKGNEIRISEYLLGAEPDDGLEPASCALDLAILGDMTYSGISKVMNLSPVTIKQIEERAMRKIKNSIRHNRQLEVIKRLRDHLGVEGH